MLNLDQLLAGDTLPEITTQPLTETQLVRYSGASGDFNPIHTVPHLAEAAGLGGIIAHGMLVMGLVGRAITTWLGLAPLRQFEVRFTGVTKPGQAITISGTVIEKQEMAETWRLRCEVSAVDQAGHQKLQGTFVAVLNKNQQALETAISD